MGKSYWYECEKCGYRAKVAGRAEQGLHVAAQTILCQDCKELYDAVTQIRVLQGSNMAIHGMLSAGSAGLKIKRAPSFQWAVNRLRFNGEELTEWLKFPLQCPLAPFHKVRAWNDPDRCPRCGVHLERSALAYRIWD